MPLVVDGLLGDEAVGALRLAEYLCHPVLDAALDDHVLLIIACAVVTRCPDA